MKKTKTLPTIPSHLGVFVDSRATETLSVRLLPEFRNKVEQLADFYGTSLTRVVLMALDLLPNPNISKNASVKSGGSSFAHSVS
jgi:hypothetical protein